MTGRLRALARGWVRWWFDLEDVRALEAVRIGVGLTVVLVYAGQYGHIAEIYTDEGWVTLEALAQMREEHPYFSVLYHVTDPDQVFAIWLITLVAALALTVGFQTSWIKWVVWILHTSLNNRAPEVSYGLDAITGNLLVVLCFTPVGRRWSIDHRLVCRRRSGDRRGLRLEGLQNARASAGLRVVQIQMTIVLFFAGAEKLRGGDWWDGDAIWYAMTDYEFNALPLTVFAENMWLVNALTYASVLVELGYAFLVWEPKTRRIFLAAAIGLHVGVAATMGLVLFAFPMIAGHLAFSPASWLDKLERLARFSRRDRVAT